MTLDCNRRDFIKTVSAATALAPAATRTLEARMQTPLPQTNQTTLDLSPAKWIWYPSGRTLANSFFLFRRAFHLSQSIKSAKGWVAVDSRYKLYVNGQYVQFGPAPCDPRWLEADPIDLTSLLLTGDNSIGVQACYFGYGDGTWPIGKPGFIFYLEIEDLGGNKQLIVSDDAWQALLARAWQPGHYKRWYVRCLQEEFDSRLYPYGWTAADYKTDHSWINAMVLKGDADKPALNASYPEYMLDVSGSQAKDTQLRSRSIPMLKEENVSVQKLSESYVLEWLRPVEEYFEFITPDAYRVIGKPKVTEPQPKTWRVETDGKNGIALTFEFKEGVVGWPYFTIQASEGTVVELLVHEAHALGGPEVINSHFNSWTRFVCRAGVNTFETFDFESFRWLQLHIHSSKGLVEISNIGLRRRLYPWPNQAQVGCSEVKLQRLFDATVNTLYNSCQETMVDGMARERQQYSGDCGHQIHAVALTFGEQALLSRYINTYSQGMTLDGYFLDSWPAYDRLARLMERQLYLTGWGPILDHSIGFNFDCYYYYLYTGDLAGLAEPYPRLLKFFNYLKSIRNNDGLLPVEDLGIPSVWIDHIAYQKQRHKQCAFNLYAAAMMQYALKPLCLAMGDSARAEEAERTGRALLQATVRQFWSSTHKLFVNNLPWLAEEKNIRTCDRSLATALLFDQCPFGDTQAALASLVNCPPEMGFSYPANAIWRYWALAKYARTDVILKDFRERWAVMDSVVLNNTLQEDWEVKPDSSSQWSHCPVGPLFILQMNLAGIQALEPGAKHVRIWPQLAELPDLTVTVFFKAGAVGFKASGKPSHRKLSLTIPAAMQAEIWLDAREKVSLSKVGHGEQNTVAYQLPAGAETVLTLKFSQ
jgi:alpha-L-rhamnosidase